MKKNIFFKVFLLFVLILNFSCKKNNNIISEFNQLKEVKNHKWYYLTHNEIQEIDLPQNAPEQSFLPWTEGIRISSASNVPEMNKNHSYVAYALVNRLGLIAFSESSMELFTDHSIFYNDTADSIIFSGSIPIFYLYKSSFFNSKLESETSRIQEERPFLVEFNPSSKLFFPLVSYPNLNLSQEDQIVDFFWDGKTWACSAKKTLDSKVEFKFFAWESLISLADLSPALNKNVFSFKSLTEGEFRKLSMPKLFEDSPEILKNMLSFLFDDYTFYITWRDSSGTSPISYYRQGKNDVTLNALGSYIPYYDCSVVIFSDGTTYIKYLNENKSLAFRLPKLPRGFTYGDFTLAGTTLYVAWEEKDFFKVGRSGLISVNLASL